jgi:hypothetical protein
VPDRIWFHPRSMQRLQAAKLQMFQQGHRSFVLPQSASRIDEAKAKPYRQALLGALSAQLIPTCPAGSAHDPWGCLALRLASGQHCSCFRTLQ